MWTLDLPVNGTAPGLARRALGEALAEDGRQVNDEALIVVSEFVSNAVRFARSSVRLSITTTEQTLRPPKAVDRRTSHPGPSARHAEFMIVCYGFVRSGPEPERLSCLRGLRRPRAGPRGSVRSLGCPAWCVSGVVRIERSHLGGR